jgi:acetyl/propionyl-CoA carboxylase alpha subunit
MKRVLVANRGEIAVRVIRACREAGLESVAVHSEPDVDALHVRLADTAVLIGPAQPSESYLNLEALLAAARSTRADAVHPGYGFLAEDAGFARACEDAGLVFIGPSPEVIGRMGSKIASRELMASAGVPVVPGATPGDQSDAGITAAARQLGYPLLVKASAGGGGKGMRVVRDAGALAEAVPSARREAASAFGDGTLYLERLIEGARHVEIQVFGDSHGEVVHLFERECSLQRRHQKIIEESPSPAVTPELRDAMGRAALALAREVGYQNAGTVEFILAEDGSFYFLEVNTRLQVEHPVTELTTGQDLVREQIRIARGEPLGYDEAPPQRGWAIEVRLCAEDPDRDHLPTTGTLLAAEVPEVPEGLRADLGVAAGSEIGIHYDSLLGKLIAHAPTRREAAQLLRRALELTWVPGLVTNREYLARILAHPAFQAGELDTHFLERHAGELAARPPGLDRVRVAAVALVLHGIAQRRLDAGDAALAPPGWRNVRFSDQVVTYRLGEADVVVAYRPAAGGLELSLGGKPTRVGAFGAEGDRVWFVEHGGHRRTARVAVAGARAWVLAEGAQLAFTLVPRFAEPGAEAVAGGLVAPMPGRIVKILVEVGQEVSPGTPLVVLEAMKMEHTVRAAAAGRVQAIHASVGQQVDADHLLAVVA